MGRLENSSFKSTWAIPNSAGVGLKAQHYNNIIQDNPDIGWFEVHAENYMGEGGLVHHSLSRIRENYPISLHGVGLSIGSGQPLDLEHLQRLKTLKERYETGLFSEHLAWSTHESAYFPDLLPVPYNDETLQNVVDHIDQVQEHMQDQMLLENPSTYLSFETSTMTETEFLSQVVNRSGCGLLLDVNNVFISANNQGYSYSAYLKDFPLHKVGEIHLAGHATDEDDAGSVLLIDTHDRPVADPVWDLYEQVISQTGPLPTLIEWDSDVPDWVELHEQAMLADRYLKNVQDQN